mmetsp:Transcript_7496/g.22241  ORF Transcript_7496/g.22241 Transcript_7496/m.22241 type:complete len:381 (-) Transcript_7496:8-1150(-)
MHVTAPCWALANLRAQAPVDSRQTLRVPSLHPEANAVESGDACTANTGASCSMSSSLAWYTRSCLNLHNAGSHTSMKPSDEPVISAVPSPLKQRHRGREPSPSRNAPACLRGGFSASSLAFFALPLKMSTRPASLRPVWALHLSAAPRSDASLSGATSPRALSMVSDSFLLLTSRESSGKASTVSWALYAWPPSRSNSADLETSRFKASNLPGSVSRKYSRGDAPSRTLLAALGSLDATNSLTICSHKSQDACRGRSNPFNRGKAFSQRPLRTSSTNDALFVNALSLTSASLSSSAAAPVRPASRRYWRTNLMTSALSISTVPRPTSIEVAICVCGGVRALDRVGCVFAAVSCRFRGRARFAVFRTSPRDRSGPLRVSQA